MFPLPLSQPNTGAAAVLVDKFDSGHDDDSPTLPAVSRSDNSHTAGHEPTENM